MNRLLTPLDLLVGVTLGVGTGVYIFKEPLLQYFADK